MVQLKGPNFSLEASGTLADILNFSSKNGRAYARKKPTPKNNRQITQLGARAAVKFITEQWKDLSADQQASWEQLASIEKTTNYHAYLKTNLTRAAINLSPTKAYPAEEIAYNAVITNFASNSNERFLDLSWRISNNMNHWSCEIHRSSVFSIPPKPSNLIAIVHPADNPELTHFRDVPPSKGLWIYALHLGSQTGTNGATLANQGAFWS